MQGQQAGPVRLAWRRMSAATELRRTGAGIAAVAAGMFAEAGTVAVEAVETAAVVAGIAAVEAAETAAVVAETVAVAEMVGSHIHTIQWLPCIPLQTSSLIFY